MKWWHWLILELLIIFGVMTWIYFFPSEEFEGDLVKGIIGLSLIFAIEKYRDIKRRKTMDYKDGMTCGECLKYAFCPVANHNTNHKACMKITTEENYTIEQNTGENRIEGGVVGISGSVNTFRCWKCGRTLPISERTDFVYPSNPPKYSCKECEEVKKEKGIKIKVEDEKPMYLYRPHDMVDAIAYAIYYTANPDSEMCVPNYAYEKAEKMFKKWKEEK